MATARFGHVGQPPPEAPWLVGLAFGLGAVAPVPFGAEGDGPIVRVEIPCE